MNVYSRLPMLLLIVNCLRSCNGFLQNSKLGFISELSSAFPSGMSYLPNRHCQAIAAGGAARTTSGLLSSRNSNNNDEDKRMDSDEIKQQLQEYLQIRRDLNADELAKQEKGKVIGGTKGNKVLEYISGAPAKEQIVDRIPNVFDYDQLVKYGFSNLVTPIMDMGGRNAVYELMDMEAPAPRRIPPPPKPVELKIDRTGEDDDARYGGMKLGMTVSDDAIAQALADAQAKAKRGERLRPKLVEEDYERPYADKRNVGPAQTPDWTIERMDEYAKRQGEAVDWARRARLAKYIQDPLEILDLNALCRSYMVFTAMGVSLAFGKSSPQFLDSMMGISDSNQILEFLQGPAFILTLANLGSSILCGLILAPPLNRSGTLWAFKGFLAGPLAVSQLRSADALITQAEAEQRDRKTAT